MDKVKSLALANNLIERIGAKARHLFLSKQLWCSEAVLVTLNQGLRGGLPASLAEGLTVGMGGGIGGSGCLCGAVNGAVVALGLFLSGAGPSRRQSDKTVRTYAKRLNTAFISRFGTGCCRKLMHSKTRKGRSKRQCCAEQTAFTAEYAARLILVHRPELIQRADLDFLNRHHHRTEISLVRI